LIEPDLAVITLIAPAHLQDLGDLDAVAREKAGLPEATRVAGVALFPRSCEQFEAFRHLTVAQAGRGAGQIGGRDRAGERPGAFCRHPAGRHDRLTIVFDVPPPQQFTLRRSPRHGAERRPGHLRRAVARRAGPAGPGTPGGLAARHWRGELRREGGRLLYIDWLQRQPGVDGRRAREFRLPGARRPAEGLRAGCMEELGLRAADYHRELGRSLRLRPGDRLFMVGDQTAALREGLIENGNAAGQIETVRRGVRRSASFSPVFQGTVFLKGSRLHRLEQALAAEARPEVSAC